MTRGEIMGRENFLHFQVHRFAKEQINGDWHFSYHDFYITCALTGIT